MSDFRRYSISWLFGTIVFCAACGSSQVSSRKGTFDQTVRPIFYPDAKGSCPAVLVLPQAGSAVSIQADDVAQKLAREGYVAQAVNYGERTSGKILSDQDGTTRIMRIISGNLTNLKCQPAVDPSRIGIVAYSLGGAFATQFASNSEENGLSAVVIYYGIYRYPELMPRLRVPILAFQGDADSYREFIDNAFEMQRIAQAHHKLFDLVMYKNAKHGFDHARSPVFNSSAAYDSWKRTIAFLDQYVKP